jgi:hypothetical protein
VVKTDSKDGKPKIEWFLIGSDELLEAINKIMKALYYLYDDQRGWKPEIVKK